MEEGLMPVVVLSTTAIHQAFRSAVPRIQSNLTVLEKSLIQWIVQSHIGFSQVEEPFFRLPLSYLTSVSASHIAIPHALPTCICLICWSLQRREVLKAVLLTVLHFNLCCCLKAFIPSC